MHSSVTFWIAGRRPSTRLKVNGLDSIRRNRVCSSASEVNTERGRLSTVESMCSFQCGKPGRAVVDADPRVGEQRPRLLVAGDQPRGAAVPDPHPGQRFGLAHLEHLRRRRERAAAVRSIGYSGTADTVSSASVSDMSHSSMSMARAGQAAAALRVSSAFVGSGLGGQQLDHAVVVALVEHVGRVQHALSGRDALVLVDGHLHVGQLRAQGPATGRRSRR